SDTSPYCLSSIAGTGANLGNSPANVNELFQKNVRLAKLHASCWLITPEMLFLPAIRVFAVMLTKFGMLVIRNKIITFPCA
ncbi:hypothetical protein, partial [Yokenella regensburgei]|uniref:hypothetical protein n=1 Tax=Yokenella regensburgei TaxID=158877 RepID=UPI003ED9DE44